MIGEHSSCVQCICHLSKKLIQFMADKLVTKLFLKNVRMSGVKA